MIGVLSCIGFMVGVCLAFNPLDLSHPFLTWAALMAAMTCAGLLSYQWYKARYVDLTEEGITYHSPFKTIYSPWDHVRRVKLSRPTCGRPAHDHLDVPRKIVIETDHGKFGLHGSIERVDAPEIPQWHWYGTTLYPYQWVRTWVEFPEEIRHRAEHAEIFYSWWYRFNQRHEWGAIVFAGLAALFTACGVLAYLVKSWAR